MVNLFDFFHHFRINSTQSTSTQANARSYQNRSDLRIVEEKVDSLALICQAMWELLEERGFDSNDLIKKIEEIDLRDGVVDGKITKLTHCPECKHKLGKRHNECFWCGASIPQNNFLGEK